MTMQLEHQNPALDTMVSLVLSDEDRAAVRGLAADLVADPTGEIDAPGWVDRARDLSCELPQALRTALRRFRRDPGREGVLLVRGLPVDDADLPPTPTVSGSVQHDPILPAAALVLASAQLGEVVAYRQEKNGALVQNVVPVAGKETFQGNAGSVTLKMHTENAFHRHSPDYVILLCLRNDHDNIAGLRTSSVRRAIEQLPPHAREVLGQARFIVNAPLSFGESMPSPEPCPVLDGDPADPNVRVDFASTDPLDVVAAESLDLLRQAIDDVNRVHILEPGDLAIVDNRLALHGRTSFLPRYDGRDRWLQRTYVHLDSRRSRVARTNNGSILT
jgi:L-asparagine oxygenase